MKGGHNKLMKSIRNYLAGTVIAGSALLAGTGCDELEILQNIGTMGEGDKIALVSRINNGDFNGFFPNTVGSSRIGWSGTGPRITWQRGPNAYETLRPFNPPNKFVRDWHASYDAFGMPPRLPHYSSVGSGINNFFYGVPRSAVNFILPLSPGVQTMIWNQQQQGQGRY